MVATKPRRRYAGVYPRGNRWAYTWRDRDGTQRWGSEATEDEAWRAKCRRVADRRWIASVTIQVFARDWIKRYRGRTVNGISEDTRAEYARDLERHILPWFGPRLRLVDLEPHHVDDLGAWLVSEDGPGVQDVTARRILAPLRCCLADAVAGGVLKTDPSRGVRLPVRPQIEEDEDAGARALSDDELARLLAAASPEWLTLLLVLLLAGLRISEALALRRKDVALDGPAPEIRVRRRWRKGKIGPPKSRYGRREIPAAPALVAALRAHLDAQPSTAPDGLIFVDEDGQPLKAESILEPACKKPGRAAGVPWATFHALRHTCATRLFAAGRTPKQVQIWLGHHDAAYTLRVYVHLLNDDVGAALDLPEFAAAA